MAEQQETNDEVLISVIDKGLGSRVHVRLSRFREKDYLDIRNFYEGEDGEWLPTRKGIAIPVELYDDLMTALEGAKARIAERTPPETPQEK
jgi:hypothetical protein